MLTALPTRLALVAILVFSQALYAGHSVTHDTGKQLDCQICLQTSASGAAIPSSGMDTVAPIFAPAHADSYTAPAVAVHFTLSHPSRAPPIFPA